MDGDEDDEWLIASLSKYEQLFMYELSTPVHLMKWNSDNESIWCYGVNRRNKKELLLLNLPNKLTDHKNPSSGRDFKISAGAIIPFEISCLQEVANHYLVVSNKDTLYWWSQEDDMLIEKYSQVIPHQNFNITTIEYFPSVQNQLTLCSSNCILLYDVTTQEIISEHILNSTIHGIRYYQHDQLVVCHDPTGNISIIDVRTPTSDPTHSSNGPASSFSLSVSDTTIGTLSGSGQLKLYDIRSLPSPVCCVSMATSIEAPPVLTISPTESNTVAVSGIIEGISIQNTSSTPPTTTFIYDGHSTSARVLRHIWHPTISRLLLSVASDGSLHAWQYIEH